MPFLGYIKSKDGIKRKVVGEDGKYWKCAGCQFLKRNYTLERIEEKGRTRRRKERTEKENN